MAAPGDPPDGTSEGAATPGDDEYRSVVFDESFVKAARLQEFSAQERMGEHTRAVRSRPVWAAGRPTTSPTARSSRGGLLLVLLIALAFGALVWTGLRHPYAPPPVRRAEPLDATVVPLAAAAVPGGTPADLFRAGPAAEFRAGAAGISLPPARRTEHFTATQVATALSTAKDYLVQSGLEPRALSGTPSRNLRLLIDPDQQEQYDRSLTAPAAAGSQPATGWLVRFDPRTTELADPLVRVQGTLSYAEVEPGALEVTTDHVFVYAVRPMGRDASNSSASLFTVRRELRLRFDRDDVQARRTEVRSAFVQAGPHACGKEAGSWFRPLLAGEGVTADRAETSDPYAVGSGHGTAGFCGALASSAANPSPSPTTP
ncbi:hypothetical protein [Streptomyces sp. NPDC006879]|uniref:SCO2583 family membrane protein n=1 Tax=Streptomyces sp. NPDC006879 TaxID=3364767 RepID=UPI00367EF514